MAYKSNFSSELSAKQTSYNVAATIVNALATAGLIDSTEDALATLESTAAKVFSGLEGAVATGDTATPSSGSVQAGSDDDPGATVFNFGAFKGLSIAKVATLDETAAAEAAQENGKTYERSGAEYLDWVANSKQKQMSFMKRRVEAFLDAQRASA